MTNELRVFAGYFNRPRPGCPGAGKDRTWPGRTFSVGTAAMTTPPMPDDDQDGPAPPSLRFDLLANPFAVLGATPRTPHADLQAIAARAATPDAAAAARTLAVPRSRLGAEVAFLPGAADAAPSLLAALAQGRRPPTHLLPPAAQANVAAHLCARGTATPDDRTLLVASQSALGDPALTAAINADRAAAGVPPLQPAVLRAEQDRLAARHAAALVAAFPPGPDGAAGLAALVSAAPPGPSATLLRRAASAWARTTAAALAELEEAAGTLLNQLGLTHDPATAAAACAAVRAWAALDAPQRAADARAGLDHEAALAAIRPWRAAAAALARDGHPGLAHTVAKTLADAFSDLPGEVAVLREEERQAAGRLDDIALERQLAPLRDLVARLAAAPDALQAELARRPFGPASRGVAKELWTLFDAACRASDTSEAPWTILRTLVQQLGGPWRPAGAAGAVKLQRGLIERAAAAGRTTLMGRLAAEQRGLVEAALTHDYETRLGALNSFWHGGLIQRRAALAALRRLLPVVADPARRAALQQQERKLARGGVQGWISGALLVAAVAVLFQAVMGDRNYARNAPYRQQSARLAPPAPLPDPPATDDADDTSQPQPKLPIPMPPSPKFPDEPPSDPPTRRIAFPSRAPREVQPSPIGGLLTEPEATWCIFNEVRLRNAETAATPRQMPGVFNLRATWQGLCRGNRTMPDHLRTGLMRQASLNRSLAAEGVAMVRPAP